MTHAIERNIRSYCAERGLTISAFAKKMKMSRVGLYHLLKGFYNHDNLRRAARVMRKKEWEVLR